MSVDKFARKTKPQSEVPTASMPDIVFMLLIFFMVTTVFKEFRGLQVSLPQAKQIEKLEGKRNVTYIWIGPEGDVCIDDLNVKVAQVDDIVYQKRVENPRIIISLKIDKRAEMKYINGVQDKLREVEALNVNYSTLTE